MDNVVDMATDTAVNAKPPTPTEVAENDPAKEAKRSAVKATLSRVEAARKKHKDAIEGMRDDINFAFGLQRNDQSKLDIDEYTINITLRNINQKVASLYARNPTAEFQRRTRMDFSIWDGHIETITPIFQGLQSGLVPDAQTLMLMQDFAQGLQKREMIDKVGQALEIVYQYQIDEHDPNFKLQMKALVRRVCTCGVGYVRVSFARDIDSIIQTDGMGNTVLDRAKLMREALTELEESGDDDASPLIERIKQLANSMSLSMSGEGYDYNNTERLVFDFLPPTSVYPDTNCRNLKGFVGAREVYIEYILPLSEVNAFFETDIKLGDTLKTYYSDGRILDEPQNKPKDYDDPYICLIEVLNKQTKAHYFVVDGYKDYVQEPEELTPCVRGFWPIISLTFNDVEVDNNAKASIFPPSDVTLMRHPQKEINRTREELRKHRNANAAKYLVKQGMLTEEDKTKLENAESNAIIEIQGTAENEDVSKALVPFTHAPIDPACYDTNPMMLDVQMAVGAQEANVGPAPADGTATGQAIAEQSRNVGMSSNIDDLDDFLSHLAQASGEILLQAMSADTVKKIAGDGAAWPEQPDIRQGFLQEVYLKIAAASSGRPNKALELQNWQLVAPLLMQAGTNPQFIVRETLKRLDDRLDPADAMPLPGQMMPQGQQQQGQEKPAQRPPERSGQPPRTQSRPGPGKLGGMQPEPLELQQQGQ